MAWVSGFRYRTRVSQRRGRAACGGGVTRRTSTVRNADSGNVRYGSHPAAVAHPHDPGDEPQPGRSAQRTTAALSASPLPSRVTSPTAPRRTAPWGFASGRFIFAPQQVGRHAGAASSSTIPARPDRAPHGRRRIRPADTRISDAYVSSIRPPLVPPRDRCDGERNGRGRYWESASFMSASCESVSFERYRPFSISPTISSSVFRRATTNRPASSPTPT